MTARQYGTLKYIVTHEISLEYVGIMNLTTFGSLLKRGWLIRVGNSIQLTREGEEAYESYSRALPSYRKSWGDISDRVRLMLHFDKNRHKGAA